MKVCLDLHDFSVVNNRLDLLLKLKEHFPEFKVSLFTIAYDKREDWGPSLVREDFLREIKKNLDWLQIIPHALEHSGSEVSDIEYNSFKCLLDGIQIALCKDGLPFVNGYCAPHWRWNEDVVRVLNELAWWGAVDRDKKMPCPNIFYRYNYLLNEDFWPFVGGTNITTDTALKIHGHIYGTKNDLGRCLDNLLRLPLDTEWYFVTDFLEKNK